MGIGLLIARMGVGYWSFVGITIVKRFCYVGEERVEVITAQALW